MELNAVAAAEELQAGAARIDITNEDAGPVHGRLHARALVVKSLSNTLVLVTIDAVAVEEIGPVPDGYVKAVRDAVKREFGIEPRHVMFNASHCHGVVCRDVTERTIRAVQSAFAKLTPVTVGAGIGSEERIMENRRLKLQDGRVIDVRHAYAMPWDADVVAPGPVDPEIGILRLDAIDDGRTVAVIYTFSCHPILGVPSKANTADITGFSSEVIEDSLDDDTVALFVQGCGGDINPAYYKAVNHPRNAEHYGNMLGLSTLRAIRKIKCEANPVFKVTNERLQLPRADVSVRIEEMESRQLQLARSLRGTSLNLKTFLPLIVKYRLDEDFPTYYSHSYLHQKSQGREDLLQLDRENRRNLEAYLKNVQIMEQLTRLNTNLALLKKHHADFVAAGRRDIEVEVGGIRIGEFILITFPGELTVPIGLNIKKKSPHDMTFVAGYTNGYIYYCPTAEQMRNIGNAQEDSDCILAPEWQAVFEKRAQQLIQQMLRR